jgi:hypothetical protein
MIHRGLLRSLKVDTVLLAMLGFHLDGKRQCSGSRDQCLGDEHGRLQARALA